MKAIDLLTRALRSVGNIGAGETPNSDDMNTAFLALNDMLDSWSTSMLFVFQLSEESFALTSGKGVYTIGPTGDFVTTRPNKVQSAYVRMSTIDYPIEMITNSAYSDISMKAGFNGIPQFMYYNPQMSNGEMNLWPTPLAALTLFIQSPKQLAQFPDLTTDILFPPGYAEAIRYGVMPRLVAEGLGKINATQQALSESSVDRIKTLNSNVPVLNPTGHKMRRFNIFGN
jgi:hypothetical protein